jgi:hypothetical protein
VDSQIRREIRKSIEHEVRIAELHIGHDDLGIAEDLSRDFEARERWSRASSAALLWRHS